MSNPFHEILIALLGIGLGICLSFIWNEWDKPNKNDIDRLEIGMSVLAAVMATIFILIVIFC